jgi:hypothetical protein
MRTTHVHFKCDWCGSTQEVEARQETEDIVSYLFPRVRKPDDTTWEDEYDEICKECWTIVERVKESRSVPKTV